MRPIPPKLRQEMANDPFYRTCSRNALLHDHVCKPNPMTGQLIEWEHALYYQGRQINEKYAIIPLCWWAHSGPGLVKEINKWIALNRATDAELLLINKAEDYFRTRKNLNEIYGKKKAHNDL